MNTTTGIPALPDGTHTIELVVPDINGTLRGKKVPASRWAEVADHGVAIASALFVWSLGCKLDRPCQYANMTTGFPDVEIVPDTATLRALPWRPGYALVIGDTFEPDGSPCVMAPRQVLRAVLERARAMGYDAQIGFEVEFYLLDPKSLMPLDNDIQCYSPLRGNDYEHVLAPIRNHLTEMGMVIEASNTEYGPGQFEVNIRFDEALATADNAVMFRHAVRDIAAQHGLLATFMAKPFGNESGCGMHIHQSLWSDGRNAFADGGTLSEVGRWYLGGLQDAMRAHALFGSPTPNAMRRRQPYTFCPTTDAWGVDNRTVGLRVIHGSDAAVRIEQRDGASDCNPYLVIAAQLAAGLRGIELRTEPGARCDGDEYEQMVGELLPTSIPDAIALAEKSPLVGDVFDPLLVDAIVNIAHYEHDTVTAMADYEADDVSPGERAWYSAAV